MKDPFSTTGGFITIGGICSVCGINVCMSNVSIFTFGNFVSSMHERERKSRMRVMSEVEIMCMDQLSVYL